MKDEYESLLEGLSELIYVSDIDTYELLYLNRAGEREHGSGVLDGAHTCYQVIQGTDAPCEFCTSSLLTENSFYEWENINTRNGRHYMLRDKLIDWKGRKARLEIAFDVTDQQVENEALSFLVDANNVIVECIKMLEGDANTDAAFDTVLRMLGEFFKADYTHVFECSGTRMASAHEWRAPGAPAQADALRDISPSLISSWFELLSTRESILIEDIEHLPDEGRLAEYEALAARGLRSLVVVPLEVGGKIAGLLSVGNSQQSSQLRVAVTPLITLARFLSTRIERDRTQRKLEQLTWSDPLTGARSRAAFHRDFDRGLFKRLGFLLVDADRLAVINRAQGRPSGDAMLRRIVAVMTEVLGERVYRIGDDEFCGAVIDVDYEQFTQLANDVVKRFTQEEISASAGPAWNKRCVNTTSLLDTAQDRMRSAKRGRHRAEDMGINLASDAAVSSLLRSGGAKEAVKAGLFDIFLMPQACGQTGQIISAEALIRYRDHDSGASALPTSFILALEDMGEIADVDFFALSKACETVARWRREGGPVIPVAVNFSRLTVSEEGFVEHVAQVVESFGLDPALIEIEVTESAREKGVDLLRQVSGDLRGRGFRVSIDDFGVDNANFSLFVQLDFDVLKLDRSLIWGLGLDDRTVGAVRGLVNLCSDLGIDSVAEGIETEEQRDALREAGCTRLQGYLIGRPVAIKKFEQLYLSA